LLPLRRSVRPCRRGRARIVSSCRTDGPTLRNVATRRSFFHNGVYRTLEHVLDFYNFRATRAQRIYPRQRDGTIALYDDLPAVDRDNVDTVDAPFDRKTWQQPPLTRPEERDIIAFLQTLTDGYRPSK
jgi:cytochrome c peroxidase